jgi:hypothetical protein
MSTLTINFNSNYSTGAHIICYKLSTDVSYTCVPITCGGVGPCTAVIPIPGLTNDSCNAVTYEGYVRAACSPEGIGEIAFSVTFTPTEPCQAVTFECTAANCDAFNAGTNCDGNPYGTQDNTVLGQTVTICYTGGLAGVPGGVPGTYTQTLNGTVCCYDCNEIRYTNTTGAPIDIQYIDCTLIQLNTQTVAAGASVTFCAKPSSYTSVGNAGTFVILSTTCP